jgi:general L-amino acid transport system substrate-binding protein
VPRGAAAVFGDASKVRYTPLTAQQRFTALQSGEVDLLARNTTWTITRDTSLGLNFVGVNFYDGQGFMVPRKLNVKSAKQLNGATVCVQPGTTTELNLADYFRANRMTFKPVVIEKLEEVTNAYFSGRCDVFTTDVSGPGERARARAPPSPTSTSSCRGDLQGAARDRRCGTATIAGSTS